MQTTIPYLMSHPVQERLFFVKLNTYLQKIINYFVRSYSLEVQQQGWKLKKSRSLELAGAPPQNGSRYRQRWVCANPPGLLGLKISYVFSNYIFKISTIKKCKKSLDKSSFLNRVVQPNIKYHIIKFPKYCNQMDTCILLTKLGTLLTKLKELNR